MVLVFLYLKYLNRGRDVSGCGPAPYVRLAAGVSRAHGARRRKQYCCDIKRIETEEAGPETRGILQEY